MRALLDTNIVLRATRTAAPDGPVPSALAAMTREGWELCICAQNIIETWAVVTRPASAAGLGLSPRHARREIDAMLGTHTLLPDPPDLLPRWLDLCTTHKVRGRQAYDARLAALMLASGITYLVTLNAGDFVRYSEITVFDPGSHPRPG